MSGINSNYTISNENIRILDVLIDGPSIKLMGSLLTNDLSEHLKQQVNELCVSSQDLQRLPISQITVGTIAVAQMYTKPNSCFCRVQIIGNNNWNSGTISVLIIDEFKWNVDLPFLNLFIAPLGVTNLPLSSETFYLADVTPRNANTWSTNAIIFLQSELVNKTVQGSVYRKQDEIALFRPYGPNDQGQLLAQFMCQCGMASITPFQGLLPYSKQNSSKYIENSFLYAPDHYSPPVQPQACSYPLVPVQYSSTQENVSNVISSSNERKNEFLGGNFDEKKCHFNHPILGPGFRDTCKVTLIENGPWKFCVKLRSYQCFESSLLEHTQTFTSGNLNSVRSVENGMAVMCKIRNKFYRALIVGTEDYKSCGGHIKVFLIDLGSDEDVHISNIFVVPRQLCEIPMLVSRCCLRGLPKSPNSQISKNFNEIVGKEQDLLLMIDIESPGLLLTVDLEFKNYLVRDMITFNIFKKEVVNSGDEVVVSFINEDGIVYLQLVRNMEKIDILQSDIYKESKSAKMLPKIVKGMPCLAIYSEDLNWYRGMIVDSLYGAVKVRFVDYGNEEEHTKPQNIKEIGSSLLNTFPAQSIPCILQGLGDKKINSNEILQVLGGKTFVITVVEEIKCSLNGIPVKLPQVKLRDIKRQKFVNDDLVFLSDKNSSKIRKQMVHFAEEVSNVEERQSSEREMKISEVPIVPDWLKVCTVTNVESPYLFYVNLIQNENINRTINEVLKNSFTMVRPCEYINIGDHVMVAGSNSPEYYHRAVITAVTNNSCKSKLIDIGKEQTNTIIQVKPLPHEVSLERYPPQAVKCGLESVSPTKPEIDFENFLTRKPVNIHFIRKEGNTWRVAILKTSDMMADVCRGDFNETRSNHKYSSDGQWERPNWRSRDNRKRTDTLPWRSNDREFERSPRKSTRISQNNEVWRPWDKRNSSPQNNEAWRDTRSLDVGDSREKVQGLKSAVRNLNEEAWDDLTPDVSSVQDKPEKQLVEQPPLGSEEIVFVTFVDDNSKVVWVQRKSDTDNLNNLNINIENEVNKTEEQFTYVVSVGNLCLVQSEEDDQWYRGRVVAVDGEMIQVHYVDFGNSETIQKSRIRELPLTLCQPHQLGYACVAPDENLDLVAGSTEEEILLTVLSKEEEKFVVRFLRNGNDEKIERASDSVADNDLELGVEDHLKLIAEESVDSSLNKAQSMNKELNCEVQIIEDVEVPLGVPVSLFISYIDDDGTLWVQLDDNSSVIDKLMDTLAALVENENNLIDIEIDTFCSGKYSVDEGWYRAKIVSIDNKKRECKVKFIDYGNTEVLSYIDIKNLPKECWKIASQGIHCSLFSEEHKCLLKGNEIKNSLEKYNEMNIEGLFETSDNKEIILKNAAIEGESLESKILSEVGLAISFNDEGFYKYHTQSVSSDNVICNEIQNLTFIHEESVPSSQPAIINEIEVPYYQLAIINETEIPNSQPVISNTEIPNYSAISETEIPNSQPAISEVPNYSAINETEVPNFHPAISETEISNSQPAISDTEVPNYAAINETEVPNFHPAISETEIPNSQPAISDTEVPNYSAINETEVPNFHPAISETEIPNSQLAISDTEVPNYSAINETEVHNFHPAISETEIPNSQPASCVTEILNSQPDIRETKVLNSQLAIFSETEVVASERKDFLITFVENDGNVWVQESWQILQLNILMEEIELHLKVEKGRSLLEPKEGHLCICKYTQDEGFYRAKVLKTHENSVLVHYVDYGNTEEIPLSHENTEEVPLSHENTEEVPLSHENTEEVPLSHENTEEVPLSHENTEEVPLSHENTEAVPLSRLYAASEEFAALPFQAIYCSFEALEDCDTGTKVAIANELSLSSIKGRMKVVENYNILVDVFVGEEPLCAVKSRFQDDSKITENLDDQHSNLSTINDKLDLTTTEIQNHGEDDEADTVHFDENNKLTHQLDDAEVLKENTSFSADELKHKAVLTSSDSDIVNEDHDFVNQDPDFVNEDQDFVNKDPDVNEDPVVNEDLDFANEHPDFVNEDSDFINEDPDYVLEYSESETSQDCRDWMDSKISVPTATSADREIKDFSEVLNENFLDAVEDKSKYVNQESEMAQMNSTALLLNIADDYTEGVTNCVLNVTCELPDINNNTFDRSDENLPTERTDDSAAIIVTVTTNELIECERDEHRKYLQDKSEDVKHSANLFFSAELDKLITESVGVEFKDDDLLSSQEGVNSISNRAGSVKENTEEVSELIVKKIEERGIDTCENESTEICKMSSIVHVYEVTEFKGVISNMEEAHLGDEDNTNFNAGVENEERNLRARDITKEENLDSVDDNEPTFEDKEHTINVNLIDEENFNLSNEDENGFHVLHEKQEYEESRITADINDDSLLPEEHMDEDVYGKEDSNLIPANFDNASIADEPYTEGKAVDRKDNDESLNLIMEDISNDIVVQGVVHIVKDLIDEETKKILNKYFIYNEKILVEGGYLMYKENPNIITDEVSDQVVQDKYMEKGKLTGEENQALIREDIANDDAVPNEENTNIIDDEYDEQYMVVEDIPDKAIVPDEEHSENENLFEYDEQYMVVEDIPDKAIVPDKEHSENKNLFEYDEQYMVVEDIPDNAIVPDEEHSENENLFEECQDASVAYAVSCGMCEEHIKSTSTVDCADLLMENFSNSKMIKSCKDVIPLSTVKLDDFEIGEEKLKDFLVENKLEERNFIDPENNNADKYELQNFGEDCPDDHEDFEDCPDDLDEDCPDDLDEVIQDFTASPDDLDEVIQDFTASLPPACGKDRLLNFTWENDDDDNSFQMNERACADSLYDDEKYCTDKNVPFDDAIEVVMTDMEESVLADHAVKNSCQEHTDESIGSNLPAMVVMKSEYNKIIPEINLSTTSATASESKSRSRPLCMAFNNLGKEYSFSVIEFKRSPNTQENSFYVDNIYEIEQAKDLDIENEENIDPSSDQVFLIGSSEEDSGPSIDQNFLSVSSGEKSLLLGPAEECRLYEEFVSISESFYGYNQSDIEEAESLLATTLTYKDRNSPPSEQKLVSDTFEANLNTFKSFYVFDNSSDIKESESLLATTPNDKDTNGSSCEQTLVPDISENERLISKPREECWFNEALLCTSDSISEFDHRIENIEAELILATLNEKNSSTLCSDKNSSTLFNDKLSSTLGSDISSVAIVGNDAVAYTTKARPKLYVKTENEMCRNADTQSLDIQNVNIKQDSPSILISENGVEMLHEDKIGSVRRPNMRNFSDPSVNMEEESEYPFSEEFYEVESKKLSAIRGNVFDRLQEDLKKLRKNPLGSQGTTDLEEFISFGKVVHVDCSPFSIWIQKEENLSNLKRVYYEMQQIIHEGPMIQTDIVLGHIYASYYCGNLLRTKVITLNDDTAEIIFIDIGKRRCVSLDNLYYCPHFLVSIPSLAQAFHLPVHIQEENIPKVVSIVKDRCFNQVCAYSDVTSFMRSVKNQSRHAIISTRTMGSISNYLVAKEVAVHYSCAEILHSDLMAELHKSTQLVLEEIKS